MGLDVAIGDLIGSLFFGGGEAAAADVAAPVFGDILGETAAAGADVGAGVVGDIAAGLPDLAATGAEAAAVPAAEAAGGVAADVGAAAVPDALATASEAVPLGLVDTGAESLGNVVGATTDPFAATAVDTGVSAPGGAGGLPASISGTSADVTTAIGTPQSAAAELASGNPSLQALADITPNTPVATTPTTAETALASNPAVDLGAASGAGGIGSDFVAGGPSVAGVGAPDTGAGVSAALESAPAAASPSLTSQLSGVLNSPWTKAGELALPLGFLASNLIRGPAPLPTYASAAVTNAANSLSGLSDAARANVPLYNATAAEDLNLANNFQISPAQAASINTWKQNQYNQLYQQIANNGNANPYQTSEWVQGKNQIDQQALAQQTQMITQLIQTAFQAASAANAGVSTATNVTNSLDATLMQAAQIQIQQDASFQQAVSSALQSFGLLAALSNFGQGKVATTGNASA